MFPPEGEPVPGLTLVTIGALVQLKVSPPETADVSFGVGHPHVDVRPSGPAGATALTESS